ncbi:MAG: leucine-rich repeat domain-containing protein, partial [Treponema sp.]|nr:leucine-rich repeat domain-containing protein [Treponema sp.]
DNPASLPLQFDLGLMTAIDSNWRKVLTAIAEADKFVNLDLETCTMRGLTENDFLEVIESDIAFYPDYSFATGKNKIVSLILPLGTRIVSAMYHWEAFPPPYPSFHYFDALEFISGEKVDRIDNYAFTDRTNLKNIDFPAARWIYRGAFWGCTSLVSADFPNSTMINFSLFEGCVNLVSVNFPRVTGASIYSDAFKGCTSLALVKIPNATGYYGIRFFSSTGDTGLTIIMGQTAPLPITSLPSYPAEKNIFLGVNSPKTVTVKVPVGATGYDEEWQSNFKYGNTNITVIIEYAE